MGRCSARCCDTCWTGSARAIRASSSARCSSCRSSSCSAASWLLDLYVQLEPGRFWRILAVTEAAVAVEIAAALWLAFRLLRPADPWLRGERTPADRARRLARARRPAARPPALRARAAGRAEHRPDLDLPHDRARRPVPAGPARADGRPWASSSPTRCSCASSGPSSRCARCSSASRATCPTASTSAGRPCRCAGACSSGCRSSTSSPASPWSGWRPTARACARSASACSSRSASRSRSRSSSRCCCCARSSRRSTTCSRGTERVAAGDFSVRVPVVGSDETGRLAGSFNQMVAGLQERARLREAFGAFVDPVLAERVLEEGTQLEGEEVEVTVVFVDIRDFTAFAERAGAREVVAELNRFYDYVVPLLVAPRRPREQVRRRRAARRLRRARPAPRPCRPRARRRARRSPRWSRRPTRASCASASASTPARSSRARSAAAAASSSRSSATR